MSVSFPGGDFLAEQAGQVRGDLMSCERLRRRLFAASEEGGAAQRLAADQTSPPRNLDTSPVVVVAQQGADERGGLPPRPGAFSASPWRARRGVRCRPSQFQLASRA